MKKISLGSWAFAFGPYADAPVPFDKVVERLGEVGYDAVEICGRAPHVSVETCPTAESRDEIKKIVADAGLEISGLTADQAGIDPADESARGRYLDRFSANLELAVALGAPGLRVDTVAAKHREPGAAMDRVAETFRAAAEKAAEAGVKIHWEFEPCFVFHTPADVLALVGKVDHPSFGVMFDTSHALMTTAEGEETPSSLLDSLAGKVSAVHLADCDGTLMHRTSAHFPLGTGKVDWAELTPKLHEVPVDYWTIDMCFWPGGWQLLKAQLGFAKRLAATVAAPEPAAIAG